MADQKISDLGVVTDVLDTDEFVLARSGTTKKITGASLGIGNGWIDDSAATWTRTADQTFTVTGDRTDAFSKGTRLRWTQTTVKYGVVILSAHAAGTTTVTIATTTDYVLTAAAISLNSYSYAANPQGYPGVFNYVPGYTGFSANPTLERATFQIIGRQCFIEVKTSAAGTSNSTSFTMTGLPAPYGLSTAGWQWVRGTNNSVVLAAPAMCQFVLDSTTLTLLRDGTGTGWTASGTKNADYVLMYTI